MREILSEEEAERGGAVLVALTICLFSLVLRITLKIFENTTDFILWMRMQLTELLLSYLHMINKKLVSIFQEKCKV